jgi:hypothetical protein
MKKLILSSLAVLGLSAAFVAPAEAQLVSVPSSSGGSMTGAASFTNFNGSTSAIAGQVTFPSGIYAEDVTVTLTTPTAVPSSGEVVLEVLAVTSTTITVPATPVPGSVEEAVAAVIDGTATTVNAADIEDVVSIARAWASGGLDL